MLAPAASVVTLIASVSGTMTVPLLVTILSLVSSRTEVVVTAVAASMTTALAPVITSVSAMVRSVAIVIA